MRSGKKELFEKIQQQCKDIVLRGTPTMDVQAKEKILGDLNGLRNKNVESLLKKLQDLFNARAYLRHPEKEIDLLPSNSNRWEDAKETAKRHMDDSELQLYYQLIDVVRTNTQSPLQEAIDKSIDVESSTPTSSTTSTAPKRTPPIPPGTVNPSGLAQSAEKLFDTLGNAASSSSTSSRETTDAKQRAGGTPSSEPSGQPLSGSEWMTFDNSEDDKAAEEFFLKEKELAKRKTGIVPKEAISTAKQPTGQPISASPSKPLPAPSGSGSSASPGGMYSKGKDKGEPVQINMPVIDPKAIRNIKEGLNKTPGSSSGKK